LTVVVGCSTKPLVPDPPDPRPLIDSNRIRETLLEGRTYEVVTSGGFDARVEDKDWSVNTVVNLGYVFEATLNRHIEQNDGRQIVERREFGRITTTKILSEAEVSIELGTPGMLLLGALDYLQPGAGTALITLKPVAEEVLSTVTTASLNSEESKLFAEVDGLTGKSVRITFVNGKGVTSVVPIGCQLSNDEQAFIESTAVLSDCYILPDLEIAVGSSWSVDGTQFTGFMDPSMRAIPHGEIVVERNADNHEGEKVYANLRIKNGSLKLDTTDEKTQRVGTFEPQGKLTYDISEGHVRTAQLEGRIFFEQVSKDHILFEARFRMKPTLRANYKCVLK